MKNGKRCDDETSRPHNKQRAIYQSKKSILMDIKINPFYGNLITIEPARASSASLNNSTGLSHAGSLCRRSEQTADRAWVHRSRLSLTTPTAPRIQPPFVRLIHACN